MDFFCANPVIFNRANGSLTICTENRKHQSEAGPLQAEKAENRTGEVRLWKLKKSCML